MKLSRISRLFFIVVMLVASVGLAETKEQQKCYDALLKGALDSTTYSLSVDDFAGTLELTDNVLDEATVMRIVSEIGRRAQCEPSVLMFTVPDCKSSFPQRPEAKVCLVESAAGYFLVSQDYLNTYHAIFVRWD